VSLDVVEGSVTLAGVALGSFFSAVYDVVAAFVLLALVAFFVTRTLRQLETEITAASPPREIVERIESALKEVRGVTGYHNLRVRRAGESVFADVHLVVERGLSVEEAHRICDEAESRVKRALEGMPVDIVIHVEPEGDE
jgi:divalent metal cation (Fe/Co/Zn/Cd) transporter